MRALVALAVAVCGSIFASCSDDDGSSLRSTEEPAAAGSPAVLGDVATVPASTPERPRAPVVVIDAGHGGPEVGAANYSVVEKESNLDFALRVERMLAAEGVRVVLTRRDDARVGAGGDIPPGGFGATRRDLQARIDIANAEDADLFLSIHSNGSPTATEQGVEVWFDPNREFGAVNRTYAETMQTGVMGALAAYGYNAVGRGIKDDTCFRLRGDRCFPLFLLGPARTTTRAEIIARGGDPAMLGMPPEQQSITTRPTEMPGVLVELLFISHPADAAVLADEAGREAIARGVADALLDMLVVVGD